MHVRTLVCLAVLGAAPAAAAQEQTPPREESVIPGQNGGLKSPHQPEFDRDATPQSTEPEREEGVQEYQGPATDAPHHPGHDMPDEDLLPQPPSGPLGPGEVPDRRFETFETEADGGTPFIPVPEGEIEKQGTP